MPGVTKHIYDHDIRDILDRWKKELETIQNILPQNYTEEDIIETLKKYYPYEWRTVEDKLEYYNTKDRAIKKWRGKARYQMPQPKKLIRNVALYKILMSETHKAEYALNYDSSKCQELADALWKKREPKIRRIDEKIRSAQLKTQMMTPEFVDKMIGLYIRKTTSQKDRCYIMAELKKYYNKKVIQFFFKRNDKELNEQLRKEAFYHLQSLNYQPRLRRQKYMQVHTKNKKKKAFQKNEYASAIYHIEQCPEELEYRIENAKEQQLKSFDFFISHSSKDSALVQKLIIYQNQQNKNIFCDWLNDSDYLKRHLLCEATLNVLNMRMEQSDAMIFVDSPNARNSVWCKYELNYYEQLKRPIYVIRQESIESGTWDMSLLQDHWYRDSKYASLIQL